jgi:hypothetical protein
LQFEEFSPKMSDILSTNCVFFYNLICSKVLDLVTLGEL